MSLPPLINEQALPTLASLSRFWQFKRKKLAAELQGHLVDAQQQLDRLFGTNQQLATQCTQQNDEIALLQSSNKSLADQLQTEIAKLTSTTQTLEQEKSRLQKTMLALAQTKTHIRDLEQREVQALKQITELEVFLEDNRNQLLSKEQSVSLLENLAEQLKSSHQHLEDSYTNINKQHLSLTEKFTLVSKILAQQPAANVSLDKFAELINHDYMEFANRESSLADEAQAVLDMQSVLAEMRMINNFPSIAGKTILSIAGGFSSGKSAFVNSFICDPNVKLATGINPVTVVPSYVVCSEETQIKGNSYNGGSLDLEPNLYASMSHEYVQAFGFDLRRILPFISVKVPMNEDLFENLCIIDTPGYNPGSSGGTAADRGTAASLVNQASALVWVIGLDPAGTIDQSDIEFIESTPFRGESLYIVLNKADVKSQTDILQIMEQVAEDLSFAGIDYAGMSAYSSIRQKDYPSSGLTLDQFLRSINRRVDVIGKVTRKLDAVFDAYKAAIDADIALLDNRKYEFDAFKLDALEIGGTALFDRIDKAFPLSDQMFDTSELERLANECESLRRTLKLAAQDALTTFKDVKGIYNETTAVEKGRVGGFWAQYARDIGTISAQIAGIVKRMGSTVTEDANSDNK
ncbi:dynamin family protein [Aeromonas caviae]|uniref:dynamin family protein n=3 Tax=Aeromonadaceae TaxID=84642 RepID=UPI0029D8B4EB|nr:dynamin family protein [Aeromonas caviae]MDX7730758.1 hypothetical protein [Aeromonas caviae]